MKNDYYYEAKELHEFRIYELQKAKEDGYEYYTCSNGQFSFYFTEVLESETIENGLKKIWA